MLGLSNISAFVIQATVTTEMFIFPPKNVQYLFTYLLATNKQKQMPVKGQQLQLHNQNSFQEYKPAYQLPSERPIDVLG